MQQLGDNFGHWRYDVLAVIQDQEHPPVCEVIAQRFFEPVAGLLSETEDVGDRLRNEAMIRDNAQFNDPDSVRIARREFPCQLQREPRLADARRAGQGQEAHGGLQLAELRELGMPANERCQLERQVGQFATQRADRRELPWIIQVNELEDVLHAGQVFEAVKPEVSDASPGRDLIDEQFLSGLGKQDLAAVPGGEQPGASVQGLPEVLALAQLGLAGMECHADLELGAGRPGCLSEFTLELERIGGGISGATKDGHGAIAGSSAANIDAAVALQAAGHDSVVLSHRGAHGWWGRLPGFCGALQVGEDKGQGAFGEPTHGHDSTPRRVLSSFRATQGPQGCRGAREGDRALRPAPLPLRGVACQGAAPGEGAPGGNTGDGPLRADQPHARERAEGGLPQRRAGEKHRQQLRGNRRGAPKRSRLEAIARRPGQAATVAGSVRLRRSPRPRSKPSRTSWVAHPV